MTWNLFLDDERMPPNDGRLWQIARNHEQVIDLIDQFGFPSYISFDHDLGDFENGNGYLIAKYLVSLDMYTEIKMPPDFSFYVHSQNPIGKANIEGFLNGYMRCREVAFDTKRFDELLRVSETEEGQGDPTVGRTEE